MELIWRSMSRIDFPVRISQKWRAILSAICVNDLLKLTAAGGLA